MTDQSDTINVTPVVAENRVVTTFEDAPYVPPADAKAVPAKVEPVKVEPAKATPKPKPTKLTRPPPKSKKTSVPTLPAAQLVALADGVTPPVQFPTVRKDTMLEMEAGRRALAKRR